MMSRGVVADFLSCACKAMTLMLARSTIADVSRSVALYEFFFISVCENMMSTHHDDGTEEWHESWVEILMHPPNINYRIRDNECKDNKKVNTIDFFC